MILELIKLGTGLDRTSLSLGKPTLYYPLSINSLFIIEINIIGGFTFLSHSVKTFNFKKNLLIAKTNPNPIDQEAKIGLNELTLPMNQSPLINNQRHFSFST
ncbi:MAG: hypothetical protein ACI8ZM_002027 [Crocinitomix sp.]